MTAATIKTAARLLEGTPDSEIVTLIEIGSEGSVFFVGGFGYRGPRWLISRDGSARSESDAA